MRLSWLLPFTLLLGKLTAVVRCDELFNAHRASSRAGFRCVGVLCRDGAVLMSTRKTTAAQQHSRGTRDTYTSSGNSSSSRRVLIVDDGVLCTLSGLAADCTHVLRFLQSTARAHRADFGAPIPLPLLTSAVSEYLHEWTSYGAVRPLAVSCLLADRSALVHVTGDGGVRRCVAGATDTADADEDAALAAALAVVQGEVAGGWAGLGLDAAVARVRDVLRTLAVDSDDGDGGDSDAADGKGNRAHEVVEWGTTWVPSRVRERGEGAG